MSVLLRNTGEARVPRLTPTAYRPDFSVVIKFTGAAASSPQKQPFAVLMALDAYRSARNGTSACVDACTGTIRPKARRMGTGTSEQVTHAAIKIPVRNTRTGSYPRTSALLSFLGHIATSR
eukprot:scaffold490362_cov30-Prasinocladus_malaysianus.AAC.1